MDPTAEHDGAGQPPLPFPPIAGKAWELRMSIDFPAAADARLVKRLHVAGDRLRRGAVASEAKLRRLVFELEAMAGIFDGR